MNETSVSVGSEFIDARLARAEELEGFTRKYWIKGAILSSILAFGFTWSALAILENMTTKPEVTQPIFAVTFGDRSMTQYEIMMRGWTHVPQGTNTTLHDADGDGITDLDDPEPCTVHGGYTLESCNPQRRPIRKVW